MIFSLVAIYGSGRAVAQDAAHAQVIEAVARTFVDDTQGRVMLALSRDLTPPERAAIVAVGARLGLATMDSHAAIACDGGRPPRCAIADAAKVLRLGIPEFHGERVEMDVGVAFASGSGVAHQFWRVALARTAGGWAVVAKELRLET